MEFEEEIYDHEHFSERLNDLEKLVLLNRRMIYDLKNEFNEWEKDNENRISPVSINSMAFTQQQQEWILFVLDDWYSSWAHEMSNYNIKSVALKNVFERAKEHLKDLLCEKENYVNCEPMKMK